MTVFKGRMIFGGILFFIILLFVFHITGTSASNDIGNFKYQDINTITISDRGLLGNEIIKLKDPEIVRTIADLLKNSKKIDPEAVNLKANQGLCDIELEFKTPKYKPITLTNTTQSGGIIRSGDFHYRNDSLRNMILNILKNNRTKN